MINILNIFENHCQKYKIPFQSDLDVKPYNESTLFCPAGMQQFKKMFQDKSVTGKTIANVQSCIRLNDYEEIGDGTHLMHFDMLGLFSFRHMSLKQAINFWLSFIETGLNIKIDYVTIHPDKIEEWSPLYEGKYKIQEDVECTWSDGDSDMAYCTEFYVDDIEIGNIVNPSNDCIDAGFGLERLNMIVNKVEYNDKCELFKNAIRKIIKSGYKPAQNKQGYILRKLLRDIYKFKYEVNENDIIFPYYESECRRQKKMKIKYEKMKDSKKNQNKSKEWWFDTHGIDFELLEIDA